MRSTIAWMVMSVAACSLCGCPIDSNGVPIEPADWGGDNSITLRNASVYDIDELYVYKDNATHTGNNRLSRVLAPGEDLTINGLSDGAYTIEVFLDGGSWILSQACEGGQHYECWFYIN